MTRNEANFEIEELVKEYYITKDETIKNLIIYRFRGIVKNCASKLYLIYGDKDDLIQEGNIGLLRAFDNYDPEKNDKFIPFAIMCIKSSQINATKKELKHKIKNEDAENEDLEYDNKGMKKDIYIPRVVSLDYEEEKGSEELLESKTLSPESIMIGLMRAKDIFAGIERKLSKRENEVLLYLVDGLNYREIAGVLGVSDKSIDNTIQRIRNKVSQIIEDENNE